MVVHSKLLHRGVRVHNLEQYGIAEAPLSLDQPGTHQIGAMQVEVVNGVDDFAVLMQQLFDFDQISDLLKNDFPLAFDAMHAVTGPYAKRVFEDLLGATGSVRNGVPLEDFGKGHPDPNLTYAHDLADLLLEGDGYRFGAACDGDGDRNMILGHHRFVNPSDSLAVLTANATLAPGMPRVSPVHAHQRGGGCGGQGSGHRALKHPPGGSFGNLLDAGESPVWRGKLRHRQHRVREKDGLWAVLFWLQILAVRRCSVADIMNSHWQRFGRHYYSRHDYEAVPTEAAQGLYDRLETMLPSLVGQSFAGQTISGADNFSYIDPVDQSVTQGQGLRILLDDGSRVVIRLSGTGTKGASIRVYLESYVSKTGDLNQDPQVALAGMINAINDLAEIKQRTGMDQPTVIT